MDPRPIRQVDVRRICGTSEDPRAHGGSLAKGSGRPIVCRWCTRTGASEVHIDAPATTCFQDRNFYLSQLQPDIKLCKKIPPHPRGKCGGHRVPVALLTNTGEGRSSLDPPNRNITINITLVQPK